MDPSFGARLRVQRERQQVALTAISEDTKIKLSILEGLERDDVSQWPKGIFRRAYVRAYARAIGLDPETLVREFLEVHPDPGVTLLEMDTELEDPRWPAGFRRLVTSAMAAVPSRRQRDERGRGEPVQPEPELNLRRAAPDCHVDDDIRADTASAVSDRADDDPVGEVSIGPEPGFSASDHDLPKQDERRSELSLLDVAELCTRLGLVLGRHEVAPILEDAAMALDAVGLVIWSWDSRAAALRPWLAYGYTDAVLAQMRTVRADADNAIAAVFESARACVISGGDGMTGAVVVPLRSHSGCVGVLAVELQHGDEHCESVLAIATILAAQFVTLVASAPLAEAVNA